MLKVSRGHWFIKYCYWYELDQIPYETTTCHLFWRGFLISPIVSLFLVLLFPVAMIILWKDVQETLVWKLILGFKNKTCAKVEIE
jgi:hypothetical protein